MFRVNAAVAAAAAAAVAAVAAASSLRVRAPRAPIALIARQSLLALLASALLWRVLAELAVLVELGDPLIVLNHSNDWIFFQWVLRRELPLHQLRSPETPSLQLVERLEWLGALWLSLCEPKDCPPSLKY